MTKQQKFKMSDDQIERAFNNEFKDLIKNIVYQDEDGRYIAFGRYMLTKKPGMFTVKTELSDEIQFGSSRSAMCWCIADNAEMYNLARDILLLDSKLYDLRNDIATRARVGEASKNVDFREVITTKLESKLIYKTQLESALDKCVIRAKYYYQRGINNEIVRTGRKDAITASR